MVGNLGLSGIYSNSLFLTAGLNDEADGLFARVSFVPEPGTITLFAAGLIGLGLFGRRKRPAPRSIGTRKA